MISLSGNEDLVTRIKEEHNNDYIEDINTNGIEEWANEFGFTIEELKWIQPNYPPTTNIEQVLDGTNGSVNIIEKNNYDGGLTIAGEFSELDGLPCLNIGIYKNNQLACLGSGVDGIIHDIFHDSGEVYVFGELNYNGEIFPGAIYDGASWNYINIPNRLGAICTAAHKGTLDYQFELAINHNSIQGYQEIWHFLYDSTWEKKTKVKGVILDIEASSYGRVHVGHLDSVVVYNSNDEIDTTFIVNNVLFKLNYSNLWYGINDNNISDTVNVVVRLGGALIFGGTCTNESGLSNICITRFFNSTLQPLYVNNFGTGYFSVNTIAYDSGNKFVFGGNFDFEPVVGTYGSNLATYDLVSNFIEPIAIFDKAVNSLKYFNNEIFIGGSFQTNLGTQNINYLAREVITVGIDDLSSNETFDIYPNPFTTSIHIRGGEDGMVYSIVSIDGRILNSGQVKNEKIEHLDLLPSGIYLLRLESPEGFIVKKIIK